MSKLKFVTVLCLTLAVSIDVSTSLRILRASDSETTSKTIETTLKTSSDSETKLVEQHLHESITQPHPNHDKDHSKSNNNTVNNNPHLHQKDQTSANSTDSVSKLFEMLNSTLLDVNNLVLDAMKNSSMEKSDDFARLGDLVRSVQTMISDKGSGGFSANETNQLVSSLQSIQKFFLENEKHLQGHLTNRNANLGQETARSNNNNPLDDFMRISTRVSQGLTASVRGIENNITDSVNSIQTQIQNQVQSFIQGITSFFTSAGNLFQIPKNITSFE